MPDDAGTVYCKWERQRYPEAAFAFQSGRRVHVNTDPLHTTTGRVVEDHEIPGLGDVAPNESV